MKRFSIIIIREQRNKNQAHTYWQGLESFMTSNNGEEMDSQDILYILDGIVDLDGIVNFENTLVSVPKVEYSYML